MAKTLLAVDDSVTMRKVLEITFSGEDFRVLTADSSQGAITKLAEAPNVIVVDTVLGGEDGYSLAKELRKRSPQSSIIMLASRYAPYDQARGRDAGADDWADKPFDTQQLIDKIRKVMLAKEAAGPAVVAAAAPPAPSPSPPQAAYRAPPQPAAQHHAPAAAGGAPAALGRSTQPSLSGSVPSRAGSSASFEDRAAPAQPAPAPPPRATPATPASPATPATSQVASAVNGQLAGKLGELGLTPQQADAVLALSRDVVERIVWEVVPQLAEALIKEEIARLTKEA